MVSRGAVRAVVYDGNEARSATTAMTGFTAPAAPFTAKTTFVVADGQCSSESPNKSYSISLKRDRAATHLFYASGLTASGSLTRG